jgi:hypothetical protein
MLSAAPTLCLSSPLQDGLESTWLQGRQLLEAAAFGLKAVVELWAWRSLGAEAAELRCWSKVMVGFNR